MAKRRDLDPVELVARFRDPAFRHAYNNVPPELVRAAIDKAPPEDRAALEAFEAAMTRGTKR